MTAETDGPPPHPRGPTTAPVPNTFAAAEAP